MPSFLKNLGLEFFYENDQNLTNMVNCVISQGVPITGYYGLPYINHHWGWAQMIARVCYDGANRLRVCGLDTHCAGICMWKVRISDVMKDSSNNDPLSKVLVVKRVDGMSLAVIHVVNADVLPSFARDEVIQLQMIAFPQKISYYPNEEAYAESVEPDEEGRQFMLAADTLFPNGLFSKDEDVQVKSLTQIRGKVKKLLQGEVTLEDESFHPFIDCIVDTQFGEIEILHPVEAVEDAQREHITVGAVVDCICYLSGDPALAPYDKGPVLDHEHHLKLIAYSISGGDPERMRNVLAKDFVYYSETADKRIDNADDYIEFVKYVSKKGAPCHPWYATITQAPKENSVYPVGTRCLGLSYGDDDGLTSLLFVDMNAEGKIQQIYVSEDGRYRLKIDEPLPEPDVDNLLGEEE